MPSVHRIRLRGGWTTAPLADGGTRYARRFGSPRALDPTDVVVLTCETLPAPATVALNGITLGTAEAAFAFDVTGRLAARNEVWIDTAAGVDLGEVAIEFRRGD